METRDFMELHRVVNRRPDPQTSEPITVNKRYICEASPIQGFSWEISKAKLTLHNNSTVYVTETYEEVKKMLMD